MGRRTIIATRKTDRKAFTVIELVICIAVIGILVGLLLPAVQAVRAAARRTQCRSNLHQLGIAMHAYESAHQIFPPGSSRGFSFLVFMLPYLDEKSLYDSVDFSRSADSDNDPVRTQILPLVLCPADSAAASAGGQRGPASTNYAGNSGTGVQRYGFNGVFQHLQPLFRACPEGPVRPVDISDGLTQTAAISELLHANGAYERLRVDWNTPRMLSAPAELDTFAQICDSIPGTPFNTGWRGDHWARGTPWTYGDSGYTFYNHILMPNRPSCFNGADVQRGISTPASAHPGGVNILFADGHVDFASSEVNRDVWIAFGSRSSRTMIINASIP